MRRLESMFVGSDCVCVYLDGHVAKQVALGLNCLVHERYGTTVVILKGEDNLGNVAVTASDEIRTIRTR